jgi:hypothetical protein
VRLSGEVLGALGQRVTADGEETGTSGEHRRQDAAHSVGEVWVMTAGRLERLPVNVGISDGTRTAVAAPALAEGAEVVTSVSGEVPAGPATSTSPLLPAFRGRGGATRGGAPPPSGR